jgi:hypothetical protein
VSGKRSIFIGYDPREATAFAVARDSCRQHLNLPTPIYGLLLSDLKRRGVYRRPIEMRASAADRPIMWDTVSDAPMSTEHANARFFVPHLAKTGWALFTDGDVLFRDNVGKLFDSLDRHKAVYCVKHEHKPTDLIKMDGQAQTVYARKNWSSVIAFNCDHESNRRGLSLDMLNKTPGRHLHALCWLEHDEIGELDPAWNFLVGYSDPTIIPKIVHFTSGVPDMPGYEHQAYATEWFAARDRWIRGNYPWVTEMKSSDQDLPKAPLIAEPSLPLVTSAADESSGTTPTPTTFSMEIPTSPSPDGSATDQPSNGFPITPEPESTPDSSPENDNGTSSPAP